jgi:hypothetical protein
MGYILRFTQSYSPAHQNEVLDLEAQFEKLERHNPNFPQGRRYHPLASGEPNHSLIWECEFPSLAAVQEALKVIESDPTHTDLFAKQSPFFTNMRTEIFKTLEF